MNDLRPPLREPFSQRHPRADHPTGGRSRIDHCDLVAQGSQAFDQGPVAKANDPPNPRRVEVPDEPLEVLLRAAQAAI